LQCVASCGNLLLTLGCEAVISLQLCEHWLMTKGLLAFVDPLLSPIQLPDVYRFDDGSHQEISRDIKLLHRSLTSLAIRMEYANLEKGLFHKGSELRIINLIKLQYLVRRATAVSFIRAALVGMYDEA
jgi:hypothetical protein